jgi:hypothetical protein
MIKKSYLFMVFGVLLSLIGAFFIFRHSPAPITLPVPSSSPSTDALVSKSVPERRPDHQQATEPASEALRQAEEMRSSDSSAVVADDGMSYPLRQYKALAVNDPYGNQWWTARTGLDAAWAEGAGSTETTVAIIDTGFALRHEDLDNRWADNTGEQGVASSESTSRRNCTDRGISLNQSCNLIDDDYDGVVDNEAGSTAIQNPSRLNCSDQGIVLNKSCDLIDNDGNGYVDDVRGWDFSNYDNNVQAGEINPNGVSTTHGTEVAGVLAATGNNGKGIAGVNWTTKVLPLQALDDDGYGDTLTVSRAIRYAADRQVDIISISLGTGSEDPYLRQAVQYALDRGSLVVAASGNDGCDCISYPARYPEVFAVGAESSQGGPASFSSYGSELDVLAPGDNITTSTWSPASPTGAYVSGIAGTSFATPYVSGLLALARSYQPDASWGELTNTLLAQARHTGLTTAAPFSATLGSGYTQADTLIARVTSASSPMMRYYFGPFSATKTLASSQVYQCRGTDFPTASVYEMVKGKTVRYTISKLEQLQAAGGGWAVKKLWYACVGLTTDTPTISRNINLFSEVRNSPAIKPMP